MATHRSGSRSRLLALAVLLLPLSVWAATENGKDAANAKSDMPDISTWKCHFCDFDYGFHGSLDAGTIGLDRGSYRFGKYSGLYHSALYPLAGGELRYRNAKGNYLDLEATRLGLFSRAVTLDAGRQGLLEFHALFRDIPQYLYDDAQTPFVGIGGSRLSLPANWATGGATTQMTALPGSLQSIGIRQKRETYGLGLRFLPPKTHWSFDVKFLHDRKSGSQVTGANFLTSSSLLPAPIDYGTDQIDAGVQYRRRDWQLQFAYYGSFFHNTDNSLTWTNPFTPFAAGADVGRLSVAPDNAFNQFSVSGAWQLLSSTRLMASAALGRELQNETFIPTTANPNLPSVNLPQSGLDGRVNTGNYTVRLTSTPVRQLSLTAEYLEDRRDNKTAQSAYTQVATDVNVTGSRVNLPYSFDRLTMRLIADYRVARIVSLEAGGEEQHYDRSFQEVARSYTTSFWTEARTVFAADFGASVKYQRSHRTIGDYQPLESISPAENPLLRKFDLADRVRNRVQASVYYTPRPSASLGLVMEHNDDDYGRSQIGLTKAKDYSLNLSGTWTPVQKASLYLYLTRQVISADQAGSQNGSIPDWFGHTSDWVSSVSLGGKWSDVLPKLDAGIDGVLSYTRETIHIDLGSPAIPQFPKNTVRELGLQLFSRYHLSKHSSVRVDYWHQSYVTRDFAFDGVAPTTISNVLTLGIGSPDYHVNLLAVSYRYSF
ncbi:MAG: MtrB/PioB family decaheme-associated outer membrane protein [Gammaproteobacteria bacterium]|nr:MtrB/PioB family decaheme-associated outer membrane protein [Gammaproteobacteria bacterium]